MQVLSIFTGTDDTRFTVTPLPANNCVVVDVDNLSGNGECNTIRCKVEYWKREKTLTLLGVHLLDAASDGVYSFIKVYYFVPNL